MKILVITDLYPVMSNEKKTPRTIYDFVRGWTNMGHEVEVIKPNFILNSFLRGKPFYKTGVYGEVENLNYWLPFVGDIKKKSPNLNLKPDIVIAHMPSGVIFANKLGFPFVAGVHVSDIEVLTKPVYSLYFKQELEKAYENAIKIACRSEILKQKFLRLYPQYENKTFVAYSGVKSEIIVRGEWQKKDRYSVLTCANLIKRKNVDLVIEACRLFKNVDLTVIGDGKELHNLRRMSKKTIFMRHVPHQIVLEQMRKSDIFILPSQNETFGMVYLEAMASGCITVGLERDGIDGIIKDGENGYLCSLYTVDDVIEKIINSENQNQILLNTYNTIKEYTLDKACENYLNNIFNN